MLEFQEAGVVPTLCQPYPLPGLHVARMVRLLSNGPLLKKCASLLYLRSFPDPRATHGNVEKDMPLAAREPLMEMGFRAHDMSNSGLDSASPRL